MFAKGKSKIIFALVLTISLIMGMENVQQSEGSPAKYAEKAADFYWSHSDGKVNFTAISVGYDIINYTWNFGDGNISYGEKTVHAYASPGNYSIKLIMKKSDGGTINVSRYMNMLEGEPDVDFFWSPETPTTQQIVYFFDNSTDPDGYEDIYNWTWVFGDGSIAYGKNVTHRFADNGKYDVTLVVRDHSSGGNSATKQVNVLNVPPVTDFYWTKENNIIRFLDYSHDPDGSIVNYTWDFGDGNISYEKNPFHNYSSYKTYTVTLRIRDDDNEENETSKTIDFTNPLPIADFMWTPDYPTIIVDVSFIDLSTDDGNIVNYTWDFGDGNISYEKNPTHRYSHKKTYTVTLTIIDNNHGLSSISKDLEVVNAPPIADFSWDPYYPVPGEIINFTDESEDKDGEIINWTWDFGDGNVSYDRNTTHAYAKNGTYTVNLTVKDNDGDISWKKKEMLVVAEIYVDDDAPTDWYDEKHVKTIQEGINNATSHAFIYVLEGTYKENVIVNKSVFIVAKNAVVDASGMGNAFTLIKNDTEISGFLIQNASDASGMEIQSNNNTIKNCTFMDCKTGIYINGGNNNSIFQNEIGACGESIIINVSHDNLIYEMYIHDSITGGIKIIEGNRNSIYDNAFSSLGVYAIKIEKGIENEITDNLIKFNPQGIIIFPDTTCSLSENTFSQNGYGISLMADNFVIGNNKFIKNDIGIHIYGNNTEIKDCEFLGGIYGMKIENSTNAYIHDCIFSGASTAIFIQNGNVVNISHSTFNKHDEGIMSNFSKNVEIFNCTFWGNKKGIDMENSTMIIHASVFNTNIYGFFAINSSFSIINSFMNYNTYGIFGENNKLFVNHTSIANGGEGVTAFYSRVFLNNDTINNNTYGVKIERATLGEFNALSLIGNNYGMYLFNSSFISIVNSSLSKNEYGLYGKNCKNITAMNNTFSSNSKGIIMEESSLCTFINQSINYGYHGMKFTQCAHFILNRNQIEENYFGLIVSQSPHNILRKNQFENNTYNFDMEGLSTNDFYEDIDTSNTINGEPLYYLVNESNTTIEEPAGYIALISCTNISLINIIAPNNGEGILIVEGDDISIENCEFWNNIEGSFILSSMDLIFNQTDIYNNLNDGALFQSSSEISILDCNIYGNGQRGINIYSLDKSNGDFYISGNKIRENWVGINIENTDENVIENNMIENNERGAIRIFKTTHITIKDNNISANGYGIDITESHDVDVIHTEMLNNENGVMLEESEVSIQNSSFRKSNAGIASNKGNADITNCTFFNNSKGLFFSDSSVNISLSSFINNTKGCEFVSTSFNILNSTIYGNIYGIISSYCDIGNINSSKNMYENEYAMMLNHSKNVNIFLCEIFNNSFGFYIINSSNNEINNCTIFNNEDGIIMINSTSNSVLKSLIHHNYYGAKIEGDGNIFINNSFWKNKYGMWIDGEHNSIYHNNFAYNHKNAYDDANNTWDNGYPYGGNYWSDYTGIDKFNGPGQNISGSDGIGDMAYKVGKSKDRYPLMDLYEKAASIPNSPPIPSFTFYPQKPFSLEYVIFTDTSTDPNGKMDIVTWLWDFGDGNSSEEQNPKHAYSHSGMYVVTLTVTDAYGEEGNITAIIEVKNLPPIANFSWSPLSPDTKESVQFTDASSDADGSIVNYTWDFGDGSYSEDKNPSHTYSDNGIYIVKLTVTDNNGATSVKIQEISVKNIPPTAEFFFIPEKASVGEEINFTDVSSDDDGNIISWHWDFGDGSASNEQHPVHSYKKGGKYTVTLTVKDDDGDEAKVKKIIEIKAKESTPGFEFILVLLGILFIITRKITFKK